MENLKEKYRQLYKSDIDALKSMPIPLEEKRRKASQLKEYYSQEYKREREEQLSYQENDINEIINKIESKNIGVNKEDKEQINPVISEEIQDLKQEPKEEENFKVSNTNEIKIVKEANNEFEETKENLINNSDVSQTEVVTAKEVREMMEELRLELKGELKNEVTRIEKTIPLNEFTATIQRENIEEENFVKKEPKAKEETNKKSNLFTNIVLFILASSLLVLVIIFIYLIIKTI